MVLTDRLLRSSGGGHYHDGAPISSTRCVPDQSQVRLTLNADDLWDLAPEKRRRRTHTSKFMTDADRKRTGACR